MAYDLKTIRSPRIEGFRLLMLAGLAERNLLGRPVVRSMFKKIGVDHFRRLRAIKPAVFEPVLPPEGDRASVSDPIPVLEPPLQPPDQGAREFSFPTIEAYAAAYRDGTTSPTDVAERICHVIEHQNRGNPPLNGMISWDREAIVAQAERSAELIKSGKARSILEGVPIAVKDEIDQEGFVTTFGTSFLNQTPAKADAFIVRRLREAGALLIGKTNMHEIGLGVTGLNPFHGTPVNPYAPWRYPGGSSSGSASVVASGLVPAALGVDGGGSVRIPAAFCGVFGLIPTAGRLSSNGVGPLAWTVGRAGPIASSARDLAILYATISGVDPDDRATAVQPAVDISGFNGSVEGLRIGVYQDWFEDASSDVVSPSRQILLKLTQAGAKVVDIEIPDLESLRLAHLVTIVSEISAAMDPHYGDHRTDFGSEARANLAMGNHLTGRDYVKAARIRNRGLANFKSAFDTVDVIATPTTAILPPKLPRNLLLSGSSDLDSLSKTMRYAFPANMLGLPAITVPAGFVTARSRHFWHTVEEKDDDGNVYSQVPVGLQFMAPHWQEALLLRLARIAHEMVTIPKPRVYLSAFEPNNPVESGRDEPVND